MSECGTTYGPQSTSIDQDETELKSPDLEREISEDLLEMRRRVNQISSSQDREKALRMIEELERLLFIYKK